MPRLHTGPSKTFHLVRPLLYLSASHIIHRDDSAKSAKLSWGLQRSPLYPLLVYFHSSGMKIEEAYYHKAADEHLCAYMKKVENQRQSMGLWELYHNSY